MRSQTRRNDPCPCGSGRKYKSCCEPATHPGTSPRVPPLALTALVIAAVAVVAYGAKRMLSEHAPKAGATPIVARPAPPVPTAVPSSPPATPLAATSVPVTVNPMGVPGSPQPPGPAPAGKVWSSEHGHWHDDGSQVVTPIPPPAGDLAASLPAALAPATPGTPPSPIPQPGPAPPGKVWSAEHGHWHDVPPPAGGP